MKLNGEIGGFEHVCRTVTEIEGLEPQQARARDLFVAKLDMTVAEATQLALVIGPAKSGELGELLITCTGTTAETLAKLFMWEPRRGH